MKMETKENTGNVLKQALEQRKGGNLPSNFSFRMMEKIHQEAILLQKRKDRNLLITLIAVVVLLVGAVAGYFIYEWSTRPVFTELPALDVPDASSPMVGFYCYIAFLGFILLGIDYWFRHKRNME